MTSWPEVALAAILFPVSRPETLETSTQYRLLGAHWYAEGLYVKDVKAGSEIQAKQLYRVSTGDFVYNRLFAWKGSFALADAAVDGCYVSNEFPCFQLKEGSVEGRFLKYYFSRESVWSAALGLSSGGTPTSRNRLKEERLLSMSMPLPPFDEQRRIADRIDGLLEDVNAAGLLRKQVMSEMRQLLISLAHRLDLTKIQKEDQGWNELLLSEVLHRADEPHPVQSDKEYPNLGIFSFGRGLFTKRPISGIATSATTLFRVHSSQFIYSRLFAFEGAYGVVGPEFDGCFVSNEYPVFQCDLGRVTPDFLKAYFMAPHVWRAAAERSKGLGDRRQRVQPEQILKMRILVPPVNDQSVIATVADRLQTLEHQHAESSVKNDSLVPSVLHWAFSGRL